MQSALQTHVNHTEQSVIVIGVDIHVMCVGKGKDNTEALSRTRMFFHAFSCIFMRADVIICRIVMLAAVKLDK